MATPNGIISTQDLEVLFTSVNTAFNQIKFDETTVVDKISYVNMGASGKTFKTAFSPPASKEKKVQDGAPRVFASPLVYDCVVEHGILSPENVLYPAANLKYDQYGVLQGGVSGMASRAKRLWDRQMADLILNNPVSFDGKSLFATDHPVNPNDAALGTYSNDLAATDLTQTGLSAALNALKQVRWMDGNIMNAMDNNLVIVVPTYDLFVKARLQVFGTLIPFVYGNNSAAAGASNPFMGMKGMVSDVHLLPELVDVSVANSDKRWYIFNASDPVVRPLITSVVDQPVFNYGGLDPNDWVRQQFRAITYGYDANGGVGVGLPQLAVRCTTP